MDIPDDKPTVSELIEFYELLIKGQLEESLPLLDPDTIRKIRNAATADEGMSLLIKAFEEQPTLLHEIRLATGKIKGSSQLVKSHPPIAPKPKSFSQSGQPQPLPTAPKARRPSLTVSRQVSPTEPTSITSDKAVDQSSLKIGPHQTQLIHVEPHSSPTVIQLSSKEEVARSIESLHDQFTGLVTKIRKRFTELVFNEKLEADDVAFQAEEYLGQDLKLLEINMRAIFNAIRPHYNFFNFGLLKSLVHHFIPSSDDIHTELTQYINSVDKFSESSQLKHIRSTIKEKLSSLPAVASPTTSDQTKVVIKLNDRWEEITFKNFKRVLQHYFGHKIPDISTVVDIDFGSVVITLLIPTSLSQSIIDTINNKTNSMSRLGILEVAVDNKVIPIRREDDNNFDISLHESVKAGDSFEVSILLQLGADPNSKDERGKSAVEIANEGGHTQIKEILLKTGVRKTGEVKWTKDSVILTEPSAGQCQEVISQLTASHQNIYLYDASLDLVRLLLSHVLDKRTIKSIYMEYTKITKDVILLLSRKIARNASLGTLDISNNSIKDDGVIALAQLLIYNKTITRLHLNDNTDITSTSAQSLAELLLYNHTLSYLYLHRTNIDTDGVLVLMESLRTNNTLRILYLDKKHKQTCSSLPYYITIKNRLYFR
ncbi:PREDICTED: uncharacterized protein LOC109585711 [Amphimedon queenslandica]|nr:PREDICTED: uncharacterized protein LOC109585711 [Amphimedon queenslandica]|eukprot:XP_019857397.1 PREDICTED: uncharacterized protein LOC109585711 [Amphimedon queenslandica]